MHEGILSTPIDVPAQHIKFIPREFFGQLSENVDITFQCTRNALRLLDGLTTHVPTHRWEAGYALSHIHSSLDEKFYSIHKKVCQSLVIRNEYSNFLF